MNIIVTDNITFMNKKLSDYRLKQSNMTVSVIIFSDQERADDDKEVEKCAESHICVKKKKKYTGDISDLVKLSSRDILSFDYSYSNDSIEYEKLRAACISVKNMTHLQTVIFIVNQWQLSDVANFITSQMYILPTEFDEKYYRSLVKQQKSAIWKMRYFSGSSHNPLFLAGYRCFTKIKNAWKRICH